MKSKQVYNFIPCPECLSTSTRISRVMFDESFRDSYNFNWQIQLGRTGLYGHVGQWVRKPNKSFSVKLQHHSKGDINILETASNNDTSVNDALPELHCILYKKHYELNNQ